MSTTTQNPTASPNAKPSSSKGWVAATVLAASLALIGMLAAVFMAVAGPVTSHASTNTNGTATVVTHHKHHHSPVQPVTPVNPAVPVTPVNPVVKPSEAIKLEQQQLGRLNYYEGPINGYDTQATVNAITYLQRDAHLPQTGHMNAATQAALTQMLITGNNHMAG